MRAATALVRNVSAAEAGQLPLTSYDVLVALAEAPDRRLRMNDLARKVVVLSRSGVTRLADRLEAEGLLRRERTPDDRRGAYAVLTEKGAEALECARPVYARGIVDNFSRFLSDDEVRIITAALERVDSAAREGNGVSRNRPVDLSPRSQSRGT